jgi:pilus assembly protein CpaB
LDRNKRPLLIVIAAVLAAGAGLLAFDYLAQPKTQTVQAPPRPVVVAVVPIGARQQINSSMVRTVMRAADSIDPGSYSSVDATTGNVAFADIPAGAALTSSNSGRPAMMPSLIHLRNGMRAMSIPVDEVKDVSGLIQPGDHVDVYAIPPRMGSETPKAFAILRNVIVLAIGGIIEPSAGASPGPQALRSVTLSVSPVQAKTLAVADLNATLRLALRPPDEPTRSEPTDAFVMPQNGPPPIGPAPAAPAPAAIAPVAPVVAAQPAPAPAHAPGDNVEYILGDRVQGPTK